MDIIIKRDGPRREDIEAKRHIKQNWGTIEKLADHISGGKYSAGKIKKKSAPQPSGLIFSDLGAGKVVPDDPQPYLRISINGRVVIMDLTTGLQMQFLGQISWKNNQRILVLATKDNGFSAPIDDELYGQIAALDQKVIDTGFSEDDLLQELKETLGLN